MRGSRLAAALLLLSGGCLSLPRTSAASDASDAAGSPSACHMPLLAGDFEIDGDTAGWIAPQGSLSWVAGGHDGSVGAAEICKTDTTAKNNTIKSDSNAAMPLDGGDYRMSGWARVLVGPPQMLNTRLRVVTGGGAPDGTVANGSAISVGPDWAYMEIVLGVTVPAGDWVEGSLLNLDAPPGTCFQVDDLCFELLGQGA